MSFTPTEEQIAQYHEEGFLLVRTSEHRLISPEDLQTWARQVHSWPKEKGKWMPYDEINVNGERQLMRTEKFVDYHPEFSAFLRGEGLINVLNKLSGTVSPKHLFSSYVLSTNTDATDLVASRCSSSRTKSTTSRHGEE
jgi:hypothetical protein